MKKNIKFSIITVNYNSGGDLQKTFDNIHQQTYSNFEHIIIDGNSTDDSTQFLENLKEKKVKFICEKDSGIYDAMNKGIDLATGDYLIFLNSGDLFTSNDVLTKLGNFKLTNLIYFGNLIVNKDIGNQINVNFGNSKLDLSFFLNYALPHQATIYNKNCFKKYGYYDTSFKIYGDLDYYLKLISNKIYPEYIPLDIAVFNEEGRSHSKSNITLRNKEKAQIFEKYFDYPSINFFTLVLNGEPFIRYHIDIFKKLPFKWHWHIIEGLADLKHDTAWSLNNGASIPENYHKNYLSIDGTSKYIDDLAKKYPDNITIYRKDGIWDGKTEMVNAPIKNIKEPSLLFQIDSDELWTIDQIIRIREMFQTDNAKQSAYFLTAFFFGEKLVLDNFNKYGNNLDQEWLRVWRFQPGDFWLKHEPPTLVRKQGEGYINLSKLNPFTHLETAARDLIFQHYPYVTKQQIEFKSMYYGDKKLVTNWEKLQKITKFPVLLKKYYNLVHDDTLVNTAENLGVEPILIKKNNVWLENNFNKKVYKENKYNKQMLIYLTQEIGNSISDISIQNEELRSNLDLVNTKLSLILDSKWWKTVIYIKKIFYKIFPKTSKQYDLLVKVLFKQKRG